MTLIFTEFIIFLAVLLNAFAGFGTGLLMVPILALLYPLKILSPLVNLLVLSSNLLFIKTYHKNIQYKILIPLLVGNFLGGILGVRYLLVAQNSFLLKILSVVILVSSLTMLIVDKKIRLRPHPVMGFLVGTTSGGLSALFATGGPPLILYLSSIFKDKTVFRATSLCYFLLNGLMLTVLNAYYGLLTKEVLTLFIISLPVMLLGSWAGMKWHGKVSEQVFRKVVFGILILAGVILLFK